MHYKQIGRGSTESPQVRIRDNKCSYISQHMIGPILLFQVHVLFLIITLCHLLFWIISELASLSEFNWKLNNFFFIKMLVYGKDSIYSLLLYSFLTLYISLDV